MRWTWDASKNRINRRRHGISFETAQRVFEDPLHLSVINPFPDEERWQTVGVVGGVTLLVIHTSPREENDDTTGRIISARKATRNERKAYEEYVG
ncbi:MAG: BrnT family toxin [Alphaproteobacteria bacterium]|nr:BrnT family toxin [Alphaproteobacteria bacterium]